MNPVSGLNEGFLAEPTTCSNIGAVLVTPPNGETAGVDFGVGMKGLSKLLELISEIGIQIEGRDGDKFAQGLQRILLHDFHPF